MNLPNLFLRLPGFYDQCGEYVRYSAQDDPGLQDMLDAYCDSAGTVVMHLLKEDQSLTLKFAIEQVVYKVRNRIGAAIHWL